jgi:serine phosphatase RsbU (regulator of sigma subunit)/Tfp pilus assembly protein PilF
MLKRIFLVLVSVFGFFLQAQAQTEDSLIHLIGDKKDTAALKNILYLMRFYGTAQDREALTKARHFHRKGIAIAAALEKTEILGHLNMSLGMLYETAQKSDSALTFFFEASRDFEKAGNKVMSAKTYYNIARVYFYNQDLKNSNRYISNMIDLYSQVGNKYALAQAYMFKAVVLQNMKDSLPSSNLYYKRAIQVYEEINDPGQLGQIYNNYGTFLAINKQPGLAIEYHEKAIEKGRLVKDSMVIAYASYCIGNIHYERNNFAMAAKYYEGPISYWTRMNHFEDLVTSRLRFAESLFGTGKVKDAYQSLRTAYSLKDSLANLANEASIKELELKFQVEKKDKELSVLREKSMLESLEKEKQESKANYLKIAVAVMFVLGGFGFFAYNNKKKANKLLDDEKKLVEEQKGILEVKNKEILDSITYARQIQNAILPSELLYKEFFPEHFILYKPKDIVAGDFYWLYNNADTVFAAVCDCTGHGVPGALVSVVCNNALNRSVKEFGLTEPGKILDKTRELVIETFEKSGSEVKDGMDISLIAIEKDRGVLRIKWAGANNSLWCLKGNEIHETKPDKQPIGVSYNPRPFTSHSVALQSGDVIYLFSDGFADQFGGPKGKKFKYKQLQDIILANAGLALKDQKVILEKNFKDWQGSLEQVDDVCIIGLKV